ncbi:MAG: DUF177 domain-containing protein [Spartobacteria bacterium]|nr:DUF177 domain-containing protein [Spartobacteria bacterium]
MRVEIARLSDEGAVFEGFEPKKVLLEAEDAHLRVCSDIFYRFSAQIVSGELLVRGEISVDVEIECSRCASFFSTTIADSSFLRAYELSGDTEHVDVTDDIREGILLSIPRFVLCSDQCQGLCPHCGINRNKETCDCRPSRFDDPWQALDGIELKE